MQSEQEIMCTWLWYRIATFRPFQSINENLALNYGGALLRAMGDF